MLLVLLLDLEGSHLVKQLWFRFAGYKSKGHSPVRTASTRGWGLLELR